MADTYGTKYILQAEYEDRGLESWLDRLDSKLKSIEKNIGNLGQRTVRTTSESTKKTSDDAAKKTRRDFSQLQLDMERAQGKTYQVVSQQKKRVRSTIQDAYKQISSLQSKSRKFQFKTPSKQEINSISSYNQRLLTTVEHFRELAGLGKTVASNIRYVSRAMHGMESATERQTKEVSDLNKELTETEQRAQKLDKALQRTRDADMQRTLGRSYSVAKNMGAQGQWGAQNYQDFFSPEAQKQALQQRLLTMAQKQQQLAQQGIRTSMYETMPVFDEMGEKVGQYGVLVDKAGRVTMNFEKSLTSLFNQMFFRMGVWALATSGVYMFINSIRQGLEYIKDFTRELANLKIISQNLNIDELVAGAGVLASQEGAPMTDVMGNVQEFVKILDTEKQALEATRLALRAYNISAMEYAESAELLIGVMKQFNMNVEQASSLMDAWAVSSKEGTMTFQELAEAFTRTASNAKAVGIEAKELTALIEAAGTESGEAAASIGTMMKFITSHARDTDVLRVLQNIGDVPTFTGTGGYRELTDILLDLGERWDELSEAQRNNISVTWASYRQSTRFRALMNALSKDADEQGSVLSLLNRIQKSYGAVAYQNTIMLNTLEGAFRRATGGVSVFVSQFKDSGIVHTLREIINLFSNFMEVMNTFNVLGANFADVFIGGLTYGLALFGAKVQAMNKGMHNTYAEVRNMVRNVNDTTTLLRNNTIDTHNAIQAQTDRTAQSYNRLNQQVRNLNLNLNMLNKQQPGSYTLAAGQIGSMSNRSTTQQQVAPQKTSTTPTTIISDKSTPRGYSPQGREKFSRLHQMERQSIAASAYARQLRQQPRLINRIGQAWRNVYSRMNQVHILSEGISTTAGRIGTKLGGAASSLGRFLISIPQVMAMTAAFTALWEIISRLGQEIQDMREREALLERYTPVIGGMGINKLNATIDDYKSTKQELEELLEPFGGEWSEELEEQLQRYRKIMDSEFVELTEEERQVMKNLQKAQGLRLRVQEFERTLTPLRQFRKSILDTGDTDDLSGALEYLDVPRYIRENDILDMNEEQFRKFYERYKDSMTEAQKEAAKEYQRTLADTNESGEAFKLPLPDDAEISKLSTLVSKIMSNIQSSVERANNELELFEKSFLSLGNSAEFYSQKVDMLVNVQQKLGQALGEVDSRLPMVENNLQKVNKGLDRYRKMIIRDESQQHWQQLLTAYYTGEGEDKVSSEQLDNVETYMKAREKLTSIYNKLRDSQDKFRSQLYEADKQIIESIANTEEFAGVWDSVQERIKSVRDTAKELRNIEFRGMATDEIVQARRQTFGGGVDEVKLRSDRLTSIIDDLKQIQTQSIESQVAASEDTKELKMILKEYENTVGNQIKTAASNVTEQISINVKQIGNLISSQDRLKQSQEELRKSIDSLYEAMAEEEDSSNWQSASAKIFSSGFRLTSHYGWRSTTNPMIGKKDFHRGLDFGAPRGTGIKSNVTGEVVYSGPGDEKAGFGGYGNVVVIRDPEGFIHTFGHMSDTLASVGDKIEKGELIGKVGSTGKSTGPHLHYEVRERMKYGTDVDPTPWITGGEKPGRKVSQEEAESVSKSQELTKRSQKIVDNMISQHKAAVDSEAKNLEKANEFMQKYREKLQSYFGNTGEVVNDTTNRIGHLNRIISLIGDTAGTTSDVVSSTIDEIIANVKNGNVELTKNVQRTIETLQQELYEAKFTDTSRQVLGTARNREALASISSELVSDSSNFLKQQLQSVVDMFGETSPEFIREHSGILSEVAEVLERIEDVEKEQARIDFREALSNLGRVGSQGFWSGLEDVNKAFQKVFTLEDAIEQASTAFENMADEIPGLYGKINELKADQAQREATLLVERLSQVRDVFNDTVPLSFEFYTALEDLVKLEQQQYSMLSNRVSLLEKRFSLTGEGFGQYVELAGQKQAYDREMLQAQISKAFNFVQGEQYTSIDEYYASLTKLVSLEKEYQGLLQQRREDLAEAFKAGAVNLDEYINKMEQLSDTTYDTRSQMLDMFNNISSGLESNFQNALKGAMTGADTPMSNFMSGMKDTLASQISGAISNVLFTQFQGPMNDIVKNITQAVYSGGDINTEAIKNQMDNVMEMLAGYLPQYRDLMDGMLETLEDQEFNAPSGFRVEDYIARIRHNTRDIIPGLSDDDSGESETPDMPDIEEEIKKAMPSTTTNPIKTTLENVETSLSDTIVDRVGSLNISIVDALTNQTGVLQVIKNLLGEGESGTGDTGGSTDSGGGTSTPTIPSGGTGTGGSDDSGDTVGSGGGGTTTPSKQSVDLPDTLKLTKLRDYGYDVTYYPSSGTISIRKNGRSSPTMYKGMDFHIQNGRAYTDWKTTLSSFLGKDKEYDFYHDGGYVTGSGPRDLGADEVPIIAKRGELLVPTESLSKVESRPGGDSINLEVNVNVSPNANADEETIQRAAQEGAKQAIYEFKRNQKKSNLKRSGLSYG